ncbi:UDP-forming cellulose synthase catalytic subunit [Azovibrio restrictus]|uniref:UDP-forming cellulose synthase catalytic subunit n=1 Tax=Azovibrio restrictus TaxID=146938 RepID=UPI0026EB2CC9|nr:UDP-forming cellulose synthase catalytic subunit [Azovibrio restrictus]
MNGASLWARGLAWVGRHLGVPAGATAGVWLYHLFVLPRPVQGQARVGSMPLARGLTLLRRLAVALARGLGRRLTPLWHPLERLGQALVPDPVRLVARLEGLAMAPWLQQPLLRAAIFAAAALVLWLAVTTPFSWFEQLLFFLFTLSLALYVRRMPGNLPALFLIGLSILVSLRYGWWRATQTLGLESNLEKFLGWGLLMAEIYTWGILLLGYIQTAWPLKRKPVPLPADVNLWPTVDIYIPTYNEPLSVVRPTVLAAKGLDWPVEKLRIYLLDDGRREEFRKFASEAGVEYMIRPDNAHAKAGNLNHALPLTRGEFIAIFDCDHIPNRSFLQLTIGWFLQDSRCAMVQTPHHFFSADPFERNLGTFRRIPNEGALFYGLVQDGNDFWNATFFCGSCAILRRGPLEEVGGIAVETVTEDAHTALKLHRRGYTTAYINITQAAGLATESLSGHVGQRIRWARGMAQIFRIDNPFLGRGLTLFQRLCYSNAMLHFFYGIPRLVFLTAPLAFLFFELHIINAMASMIALYVLPHIVHSNIANARIQGPFRHTFWAEVYESVLAWYITLPTTIAFINPRLGKFNVTAKGGLVEESYFDWVISRPYLILVGLNLIGFGIGLGRLFFWNTHEQGTVLLNLLWTFYNLLMLGAAVSVATEQRQVRVSHRVPARLPAMLRLQDGRALHCCTEDFSLHGLGLLLDCDGIRPGDVLKVSLWRGTMEQVFPARVVVARDGRIGVCFEALTLEQEAALVQCTFARADIWSSWRNEQDADRPLLGMKEIFTLGLEGYWKLAKHVEEGCRERWQRLAGPSARDRAGA